jgi:DNA adenine methylase
MTNAEPFLKWAGGKRWLVRNHASLFPAYDGTYFEPFLGSASVFFHLNPRRASLSDSNHELVATYRAVRDCPHAIEKRLAELQKLHSKKFYYRMRASSPCTRVERAAKFIYLNRTCWNGLYRVNRKGIFNVPIGTKNAVEYPPGALIAASHALANTDIDTADFEGSIDKAKEGDFLFVDPPYTVSHNNNGFIKYNDVLFSWEDQVRLAKAVQRAVRRGALVLVSNANHDKLIELYKPFMAHRTLGRASVLSGKAVFRRRTEEAVFLNYASM